jgi:ComF family protein
MEFNRVTFLRDLKIKSHNFIKGLKSYKAQLSCCDLCGNGCNSQAIICDFCLADLPLFDIKALHGDLLTWPAVEKLLPKKQFDQLITVSPYQWPVDSWVRQLKYHGRFELVNLLSLLLFQQWKKVMQHNTETLEYFSPPLLLLSVPIHLKKWQHRGFNQAHLLAESFADKVKIPYFPNALTRTHNNISQAGQTGISRRKNLRHAFELSTDFLTDKNNQKFQLPEHVMLLDDVVTTGSTCNEICRLLKANGVKKVTVISICLSLPENTLNIQ